jgi:uncharacterized protein (TIGR02145 family)
MKAKLLLATTLLLISVASRAQMNVTDFDGNTYATVTIGAQVWFKENLRSRSFNNGTSIPRVNDNAAWSILTTPGFSWYNGDSLTYNVPYGRLYNGYVITNGNICPTGWRVPSDADWTTLSGFLGGASAAGGKMKETGISHWSDPNTGATNESGFTALPGGARFNHGGFTSINTTGRWWSSNITGTGYLDKSITNTSASLVSNTSGVFKNGFSIRCMKDVSTDNNESAYSTELLVFPNPASGFINIKMLNESSGISKMKLYNSVGVVVLETELSEGQGLIDLSEYPSGFYLIRIETINKTYSRKLILE